jgi:hypothetical protein
MRTRSSRPGGWGRGRSAVGLLRTVVTDPIEVGLEILDLAAQRRERKRPPWPYEADAAWEPELHELLDAPWPCPETKDFWTEWSTMLAWLQGEGINIGRGAFGGRWGDGEPGLTRAIWCIARHLRPERVVETGVARGITTRFILAALDRNGTGTLCSIDLPPQGKPGLHRQIAVAVPSRLRDHWTYVQGSSRRRLPGVLSRLAPIDLFVHDSRHTERNLRFELDRAWAALRPGGMLVADDIDVNWGFHSFEASSDVHRSLICRAEPLKPDPIRRDGVGFFGIVRKDIAT